MKIIDSLIDNTNENKCLRRDIHAHPELGFEEHRTANVVAEFLKSLGIEVHEKVGGTGVVGVIKKGLSQKGLALRADMDALPIHELNKFKHASQNPGKMHACGHDGHTTMLLSAARVLAQETQFDGTVVLIFQPSEETLGGANAMIRDGLFERFPADAIFGLHNRVNLPLGDFTIRSGVSSSAMINFKILLKGEGTHAAMPHLGIDPIPAASQLIQSFQTIITRNKRPIDSAVISVTMIHAGEVINAIPSTCILQGTVRCANDGILEMIKQRMQSIIKNTASAFDLQHEIEWSSYCPSIVNCAKKAQFLKQLMIDLVGPEKVHEPELTMGADDFSYFLKIKPGSYFCIGNGEGYGDKDHRLDGHGGGPCALHNASYDFNDALIPIGATFWVRLVERWFTQP
jgi:amidohydrolase